MKLIYIAGAFSAPTDEARAANIAAAERAGERVMALGVSVFVPHLAWGGYYGRVPERNVMAMCLDMIGRCQAVFVFDDQHYQTSRGTHQEAMHAHAIGVPVFADFARLRTWLDGQFFIERVGREPRGFDVGKDLPWAKQRL